jgi:hypothetical protein
MNICLEFIRPPFFGKVSKILKNTTVILDNKELGEKNSNYVEINLSWVSKKSVFSGLIPIFN